MTIAPTRERNPLYKHIKPLFQKYHEGSRLEYQTLERGGLLFLAWGSGSRFKTTLDGVLLEEAYDIHEGPKC